MYLKPALLTPASKWLLLSLARERRLIYMPQELLVQQKDKGSIITEFIYRDGNQLHRDNQMCFSAQNGPFCNAATLGALREAPLRQKNNPSASLNKKSTGWNSSLVLHLGVSGFD